MRLHVQDVVDAVVLVFESPAEGFGMPQLGKVSPVRVHGLMRMGLSGPDQRLSHGDTCSGCRKGACC